MRNNYFAFIIGIDEYNSSEISDLQKAKKDAEDFRDFLINHGGYYEENTVLLTNNEVTKENIKSQIKELSLKISEDSTFVLFISGHGGNKKDKYFLPLFSYSKDAKDTYLDEDEIIDLFNNIDSDKTIFLLDSCHAGTLAREKNLGTGITENLLDKLISTNSSCSRVLIASSLPYQISWENDNIDNGIFTYCLLKALKGACQEEKGNDIYILDLIKYLIKSVPTVANQYGVKQNCCVKTSVLYNNFSISMTSGEMDYSIQLPNRYINAVMDLEEDQNKLTEQLAHCMTDRKLDSKFAYWGEEVTKKYIELINVDEYKLPNMTRKLLSTNIKSIIANINKESDNIRVISLGIGDGLKDAIILNEILDSTKSSVDYWIIEISYEMIKVGLNNVRQNLKELNRQRFNPRLFQTDFIDIDILSDLITDDKRNLFLLLGNTLGNFPEDILLNKIKSVMHQGDFFLIDNQIKGENRLTKSEKDKLLKMYNNKKYNDYIFSILKNARINNNDGEISTRVESYNDASIDILRKYECVSVIKEFKFTRTRNVEIGDKKISFDKGTILPVIYSRKYTQNALKNLLSSYFKIVGAPYYLNTQYALFLLKK